MSSCGGAWRTCGPHRTDGPLATPMRRRAHPILRMEFMCRGTSSSPMTNLLPRLRLGEREGGRRSLPASGNRLGAARSSPGSSRMRRRILAAPPTIGPRPLPFRLQAWSIYGAQRAQPVATGGKWDTLENHSNNLIRNRWQPTATVSQRMVRRGSPVRVRKRALQRPRKRGLLSSGRPSLPRSARR
jgi:hypothetical protein